MNHLKNMDFESQEQDFYLPNGAVIKVSVDESGALLVNAISGGTKLAIEPRTQNSMAVTGVQRSSKRANV